MKDTILVFLLVVYLGNSFFLSHCIMDNFLRILKCFNDKIQTSVLLARVFNFMIFILIFMETVKHDFSVRMRIGSNPEDINRFQSDTGKKIIKR